MLRCQASVVPVTGTAKAGTQSSGGSSGLQPLRVSLCELLPPEAPPDATWPTCLRVTPMGFSPHLHFLCVRVLNLWGLQQSQKMKKRSSGNPLPRAERQKWMQSTRTIENFLAAIKRVKLLSQEWSAPPRAGDMGSRPLEWGGSGQAPGRHQPPAPGAGPHLGHQRARGLALVCRERRGGRLPVAVNLMGASARSAAPKPGSVLSSPEGGEGGDPGGEGAAGRAGWQAGGGVRAAARVRREAARREPLGREAELRRGPSEGGGRALRLRGKPAPRRCAQRSPLWLALCRSLLLRQGLTL